MSDYGLTALLANAASSDLVAAAAVSLLREVRVVTPAVPAADLRLVSAETLAPKLGFPDAKAITRLAREKVIPGVKLGKEWRFDPAEVSKALAKLKGGR